MKRGRERQGERGREGENVEESEKGKNERHTFAKERTTDVNVVTYNSNDESFIATG